ncbi:MAG: hypothetical protein E7Z68_02470 [Thermoplasmata archaeon]|nr:hypothetical protein [Thermoplasmata archaeon]
MTLYIAYYNGEKSGPVIKDTLRVLGKDPEVILLDTVFDDGSLRLKSSLEEQGYSVRVEPVDSMDFHDLVNLISVKCIEHSIRCGRSEIKKECYIEAGGLEHVMAGTVFTAAFSNSSSVVYMDGGELKKIPYEPFPDVSRIGYLPYRALSLLYAEEKMDFDSIERGLYADQTVGMDEEDVKQFFETHHNAYKVLGNLRRKDWISFNKKSGLYSITSSGNIARVLLKSRFDSRRGQVNTSELFDAGTVMSWENLTME